MARLLLILILGLACGPAPVLLARAAQEAPPPGGPEPVLAGIVVRGAQRVTESQVISALGQRVGQPVDGKSLEQGVLALWNGFSVRATVRRRPVAPADVPPGIEVPETPGSPGAIELLVDLVEIPVDFEPRFIGNADVALEEVLSWAGLAPGSELHFNQAQRVARQIEVRYKREGYYFAEVELVVREGDGELAPDVIFEIREGPQVHVRTLVVEGNESLPDRGALFWKTGLRSYADVELGGPFLYFFFRDPFVEEVLEADLVAMRQVYRDRGWLDAVIEIQPLEFSEDRSWVTIRVQVDEGRRYEVASLNIEAVQVVEDPDQPGQVLVQPGQLLYPEDELLALCNLTPGQVFQRLDVDHDNRALLAH